MHRHDLQSNHSLIYRIAHLLAVLSIGATVVGGIGWYIYQLPYSPPGITPLELYVEIPSGSSARQVAELLEGKGVIRNAELFIFALRAQDAAQQIKSGQYYFGDPESLESVIERITTADYGLPTTRVTLVEGRANYQYAAQLAEEFEFVSEARFRTLAKPHEGYLFPDTYFFPNRSTAQELIDIMRANFDKQVAPLEEEIAASPYTLDEVITMASLVENEAGSASYETKQKVAGVLFRRLDEGMLLQADAVFSYIYQMHLPRVLYRHLEVDSPYNVYQNTGLPPGPIGNPGIDSIRATLNPIDEGYRYYLTGNDGNFYYATTLAGHEQNRRNYLQY
jgi:UPF0755 protein